MSGFRVVDVKNPASLSTSGVRGSDITRRQMAGLLDGTQGRGNRRPSPNAAALGIRPVRRQQETKRDDSKVESTSVVTQY
jgi:hypothetical protein